MNDPLEIWKTAVSSAITQGDIIKDKATGYAKILQLTNLGSLISVVRFWPFSENTAMYPAALMACIPIPLSVALLGRRMRRNFLVTDERSHVFLGIIGGLFGIVGFATHYCIVMHPLATKKNVCLPCLSARQSGIFASFGLLVPSIVLPTFYGIHFIHGQSHAGTLKAGQYIKFIYKQSRPNLSVGFCTSIGLLFAASILCVYLERYSFSKMAAALEMDDEIFEEVLQEMQKPTLSFFVRLKSKLFS